MAKYHIKRDGTPGVCHAEKGKCPLGGVSGLENHYNTRAEAQAAADKKHELAFNLADKPIQGPTQDNKEALVASYGERVAKWENEQQYKHPAPKAETDVKKHLIDAGEDGWNDYEQNVDTEEDIDLRDDLSTPVTLSNGETYTAVQWSMINGTGQPTPTLLKDKTDLSKGYLELYPKYDDSKFHSDFTRDRDEVVFDRKRLGNDTETIMNALSQNSYQSKENVGIDNSNEEYPSIKIDGMTDDMFSYGNLPDDARLRFDEEYKFTDNFKPSK